MNTMTGSAVTVQAADVPLFLNAVAMSAPLWPLITKEMLDREWTHDFSLSTKWLRALAEAFGAIRCAVCNTAVKDDASHWVMQPGGPTHICKKTETN